MPLSFVIIGILLFFTIIFRWKFNLNVKVEVLISVFALLMIAFFIPNITIFKTFNINLLIFFTMCFIVFYFLSKIKFKDFLKLLFFVLCQSLIYYFITSFLQNKVTDVYLITEFLIITLFSLIFFKEAHLFVSSIIFSSFVIECCNFYIYNKYLGFANIFQTSYLDLLFKSILTIYLFYFVFKLFFNKKKVTTKGEQDEKV